MQYVKYRFRTRIRMCKRFRNYQIKRHSHKMQNIAISSIVQNSMIQKIEELKSNHHCSSFITCRPINSNQRIAGREKYFFINISLSGKNENVRGYTRDDCDKISRHRFGVLKSHAFPTTTASYDSHQLKRDPIRSLGINFSQRTTKSQRKRAITWMHVLRMHQLCVGSACIEQTRAIALMNEPTK